MEKSNCLEQNYTKASEYYEKSANLNNSNALNNLGRYYINGKGVEKNYTKAFEFFEKASKFGNSKAFFNIALLYQEGLIQLKREDNFYIYIYVINVNRCIY